MKSFKPLIVTTLLFHGLAGPATAQTVYRCGNSYSQSPCAGAIAVSVDDPRTEAQRAAADAALARNKALAQEMEDTRRRDEAQALAADKLALSRATAEHKKAPQHLMTKKPAAGKKRKARVQEPEPGVFTAVGNSAKKKAGTP